MPRVSVPPYPIAGGVDDLDEDTPPIIPQFTGERGGRARRRFVAAKVARHKYWRLRLPLLVRPPGTTLIRPALTRNSSMCRSRRSLLSSPQSSLMSADPDLLSMASSSLSYRPEADDDVIMFNSERRGYVWRCVCACVVFSLQKDSKEKHFTNFLHSFLAPKNRISRAKVSNTYISFCC